MAKSPKHHPKITRPPVGAIFRWRKIKTSLSKGSAYGCRLLYRPPNNRALVRQDGFMSTDNLKINQLTQ